jgi:hypothetical protein
MTHNVIQLPYPHDCETPSDYRFRRELWRTERGWITRPEKLPSWDQRIEIGKRMTDNRPLPLFVAAEMRSAS